MHEMEHLAEIKEARCGKEVREPIVKILQGIYQRMNVQEPIEEVEPARGNYDRLYERMDTNAEKIRQKTTELQSVKDLFTL